MTPESIPRFAPGHRLNNEFLHHLAANAGQFLEERVLRPEDSIRSPRPYAPRVEAIPAVA